MKEGVVEGGWKIKHIKSAYYKCKQDAACTLLYRDVGDGFFEYKFAICNPNDMFERKKGIEVALEKTEIGKVFLNKGSPLFQVILMNITLTNRVTGDFIDMCNDWQHSA